MTPYPICNSEHVKLQIHIIMVCLVESVKFDKTLNVNVMNYDRSLPALIVAPFFLLHNVNTQQNNQYSRKYIHTSTLYLRVVIVVIMMCLTGKFSFVSTNCSSHHDDSDNSLRYSTPDFFL
uniref:Uncharacterized protein n=1 Tax=Glossina pallidipes TaxID=7398 RepID=A0A1A9ZCI6_GLOPL